MMFLLVEMEYHENSFGELVWRGETPPKADSEKSGLTLPAHGTTWAKPQTARLVVE